MFQPYIFLRVWEGGISRESGLIRERTLIKLLLYYPGTYCANPKTVNTRIIFMNVFVLRGKDNQMQGEKIASYNG